jgi:hypothetical protein
VPVRATRAGLRLLLAAMVIALAACSGHAVSPSVPFTGAPRYDFCKHRERPEAPGPDLRGDLDGLEEDAVMIRYLGAGGLYVGWRGAAVMTGPFFSNPGALRVALGHLRPRRAAIARGLAGVPVDRVGAILVGHSHYDHLGDLPVVASEWTPGAAVFVNRSGERSLASYPALAARVTTLEEIAGRWTRLHDAGGRALPFRVLAVPSDHAPHVRGILVMDGESEVHDGPWETRGYWALRTGRTYAFVLDLLDGEQGGGEGRVRFRILLQDAASPAPADSLPPAADGAPGYDLAVLCMPSADLVPPYPREVLGRTAPRHALVTHYEDFFAPWGRSCRFAPLLTERKANAFLEATDDALGAAPGPGGGAGGRPVNRILGPAGERWTMPRVGEWLVFRPGSRGTGGGP